MKLSDWLIEQGIPDSRFAETIGVTRQALFRYKVGDRTPRPAILTRIFENTGGQVTANDFAGLDAPAPQEARAE